MTEVAKDVIRKVMMDLFYVEEEYNGPKSEIGRFCGQQRKALEALLDEEIELTGPVRMTLIFAREMLKSTAREMRERHNDRVMKWAKLNPDDQAAIRQFMEPISDELNDVQDTLEKVIDQLDKVLSGDED